MINAKIAITEQYLWVAC